MDYDDNDFEGRNLHLVGEESSKIYSVSRPFALPKFDFDDSLHGHLRFDSLVENEVFLGIPSQEDNQWIENFSRGSRAIDFSSTATECCTLPRHNNVWSEATSSESVEMLLKAVGQEEMVPVGNISGESDKGDQSGRKHIEINSRQDDKIDKLDDNNSSLSPSEVERLSSEFKYIPGEYTLLAMEKNYPLHGVGVDCIQSSFIGANKTLDVDLKSTDGSQRETRGLVNDFVSEKKEESQTVLGMDIDSTISSSQDISVIVGDSGHQEKVTDVTLVKEKSIHEQFEEQEKDLGGNATVKYNPEMDSSLEIASRTIFLKEEQLVDICVTNSNKASCKPGKVESASTDGGCTEVAPDETAGGSKCGAVVSSSDIEIKLPSESCRILHEKTFFPFPVDGCIQGSSIKGSETIAPKICGFIEQEAPVFQSLDKYPCQVGDECIPGSQSSPEASRTDDKASAMAYISDNMMEENKESNINHAHSPGNSGGEKLVAEDTGYSGGATIEQKNNLKDCDDVHPLQAGSTQTCGEDTLHVQANVDEPALCVPCVGKETKNSHLDMSNAICNENEKVSESNFTCEGAKATVEEVTVSQSNNSAVADPILNSEIEATEPISSSAGGGDLVDCGQQNLPSFHNRDDRMEICQEPNASDLKGPLEVANEVEPSVDIEKGKLPDSAAGGKEFERSAILDEAPDTAVPDTDIKKLNEEMGHPASDIVQLNSFEPVITERPAEVETSRGANSSIVSVSCNSVENDKSNHLSAVCVSMADITHCQINKNECPAKEHIEKVEVFMSPPMNARGNTYSKEEGTFTFNFRSLGDHSAADSDTGLLSFSRSQACKLSLIGDESPSTSGSIPRSSLRVKEISQAMPSIERSSVGSKGPSERKTRRGSSKSGKESVKKANVVKEASLRPNDRGDKSSISLSPVGSGQLMTFESVVKPRGVVSVATSSLPDLNTSMPSCAFFQQPFTDLQQVQLRAQIFVYGSLIQGAAPDEACMISAFDGGRSVWEPSWHACVEMLHGQNLQAQGLNTDTPLKSRSGVKAADKTSRQAFHQSEVISLPAGRTSHKSNPSPVVNPIIPVSSPLWNVASPSSECLPAGSIARSSVFDYQAISALQSYQTPSIRNFGMHTTTWPSQAPFTVPWVASSQSSSYGVNFSAFPTTEPLKSTPDKQACLPASSGPKHIHVSPIHAGASAMFGGTSSLTDLKKVTVSASQASAETKSRKRKKSSGAVDLHIPVTASLVDNVSASVVADHSSKKVPALENISQVSVANCSQAESMLTPFVSCHYSTTVSVQTPSSFVPKDTGCKFFPSGTTSMRSDQLTKVDLGVDGRALNLETFNKVEESKLQAEVTAAHAAAAIRYCQGVWSQLDQQRNSCLTLDAEAKLASAAATVAAAAAVAKAATAAAKVASTAAMQAKQMADEAVSKSGAVNASGCNPIHISTTMNNMENATPASILKGGDMNSLSTFAISAAREAARKRVEAASAATRQAENLDAIVRAAELAAEAVSHVGKILSMGNPISLSELVEEGPDGYWKVSDVPSSSGPKPNDNDRSKLIDGNVGKDSNVFMSLCEEPDKDMQVTAYEAPPIQRELCQSMVDNDATAEENPVPSAMHEEENLKCHKEKRKPVSAKASGMVSEPYMQSRSNSFARNSYEPATNIKEGSIVEVLKDQGELQKAWFSANVLSLKVDEVLVCYTELQSNEGSEPLKEWLPLDGKDGNAPIVRIPHPSTSVQFEGPRKRRRAAAKDYVWSVGDKVDAWVQDCWREGIIAEKHKTDAATFSVHFEAPGETLLVKAWKLRPTLIWRDGVWIECCRPEQGCGASRGDTPQEKRPRLGNTVVEEGKLTKNIDYVEIGSKEETRLPLSANEKFFSIGSMRDEKKLEADKRVRSGSQKEGSRVIFGVPKPGKKRKFMEVSKHYVSDMNSKTNVPNDSVKLASLLVPQGALSRGLKVNSKPDLKEKQPESKPKALRSGKPPIPSRTLSRKDDSISLEPNMTDAVASDHIVKDSVSNNENASGEQNLNEFRSFSNIEVTSGSTIEFSSQALPPANRKKTSVRSTRSDRLNKGKFAVASVNLAKVETQDKVFPEVSEPRRSNRRIQPTSRLLEGLQSSLIISKIPSSAHDKSHRSHIKGTPKGNNNRG